MNAKIILTHTLREIGVEIDRDILVRDDRFYARVLNDHSIGMGESYMDGWWDSPDLVALFRKIISGLPVLRQHLRSNLKNASYLLLAPLLNRQHRQQARRDVQSHYDIGDELFEVMLDKNMVYTCAYFHRPNWTLEQAQVAKIDMVYQKLNIPREAAKGKRLKVLDIGCGWGYGLIHGAKHYGIDGIGVTLSKDQAQSARLKAAGLPIDIMLQDYRDLPGKEQFDAIFSLGMFEHVGQRNYGEFMRVVERLLKPDGLFLLHTIGTEIVAPVDPWMNKYIFPGAWIPTRTQLARATEERFIEQDFHNFGLYYAKTAEIWYYRFEKGFSGLQALKPEIYTERFFRMWKYYLLVSAAGFHEGRNQLWQVVYSRQPLDYVYEAIRAPETSKSWRTIASTI